MGAQVGERGRVWGGLQGYAVARQKERVEREKDREISERERERERQRQREGGWSGWARLSLHRDVSRSNTGFAILHGAWILHP